MSKVSTLRWITRLTTGFSRGIAVCLCLMFMAMLPVSASDQEQVGVRLVTSSVSTRDRELIVQGANSATAFLATHGMALRQPIEIYLHATLPGKHPDHVGMYSTAGTRIDLLDFDAANALIKVFRAAMDETLYVSFVAHEVAHALADQHFDPGASSRLAHEYIAYVTQLTTMPENRRRAILADYDLPAFADSDEISLMYYALDPCAFGVKAYLHYRALPDRQAFISGLLDGSISLAADTPEWW